MGTAPQLKCSRGVGGYSPGQPPAAVPPLLSKQNKTFTLHGPNSHLPEQRYTGRSPGVWDLRPTGLSLEDAELCGVDTPAL